jgi:hypothetical protein
VIRDVVVAVNQTVRIDPTLDVGDITTRVEVEASAPIIQTDTSSVGNIVDGKQIVSMPLNGRNNLNSLLACSRSRASEAWAPTIRPTSIRWNPRTDRRRPGPDSVC